MRRLLVTLLMRLKPERKADIFGKSLRTFAMMDTVILPTLGVIGAVNLRTPLSKACNFLEVKELPLLQFNLAMVTALAMT